MRKPPLNFTVFTVLAIIMVVAVLLLSAAIRHTSAEGAVLALLVAACVGATTWRYRLYRCRTRAARHEP